MKVGENMDEEVLEKFGKRMLYLMMVPGVLSTILLSGLFLVGNPYLVGFLSDIQVISFLLSVFGIGIFVFYLPHVRF